MGIGPCEWLIQQSFQDGETLKDRRLKRILVPVYAGFGLLAGVIAVQWLVNTDYSTGELGILVLFAACWF
eukprot:gene10186-38065_t